MTPNFVENVASGQLEAIAGLLAGLACAVGGLLVVFAGLINDGEKRP